jgi:hypothetical protein
MKLLLEDSEMDAQLQRTATAVCSGSADLGEALVTAGRVPAGDYDRWYSEWGTLAENATLLADDSLRGGHHFSAARAFLRATEYWRQAIFFIRQDLHDPRLLKGWRSHRDSFRAALSHLPWSATIAALPFDGGKMTTYLLRPDDSNTRRPTVLAPCGIDSTAEAGYAATAYMALPRGYNILLWDGPGQGGMLYEYGVAMRPDFESVVSPVVDWLLEQAGVDPSGLVLLGRSFAGYLAPRAASAEQRLAALVCDPGQVEFVSRIVPSIFDQDTWTRILAADPNLEAALQGRLEDPSKREWYGARMATLGAKTLGEFLRMQPLFSVQDRVQGIRCPTLVTEGEGDFASQSQRLYDLLSCKKHFHRFTESEGAGGHCCGLGATLRENVVFDWIDQVLG